MNERPKWSMCGKPEIMMYLSDRHTLWDQSCERRVGITHPGIWDYEMASCLEGGRIMKKELFIGSQNT